jgi:hypothetical protein
MTCSTSLTVSRREPVIGEHIHNLVAHVESFVPHTADNVACLVTHPSVSEADAHKVLFESAAELYGLDLDMLGPHIERVGFELADVLASSAA